MNSNIDALTERIHSLSAEQIAEVEEFVEFVRLRGERCRWARVAAAASEASFAAVWDNPEDAAYDDL